MNLFKFDAPVDLHPVPVDEDYGIEWPSIDGMNVSQPIKELSCIRLSRKRKTASIGNIKDTFYHMINFIRMTWPSIDVSVVIGEEISSTGKPEVVFNTYFLNVVKFLCEGKSCCLTGPASAAKTFGVSVYMLCSYYSNPAETMGIISTTSGAASEARVWADLKELHRTASFSEMGVSRDDMGVIIPYLKCITFDSSIDKSNTASERDFRNGLMVVPIAKDKSGDTALDTIMGRKNNNVIWAVDELPAMNDNVLRPRANIEMNPFCQVIGIGNACNVNDPHGRACKPVGGWSNPIATKDGSKTWEGETMEVLYLDGDESPNDNPLIDQGKIQDKDDYPFPYLSNKISRDVVAKVAGDGDRERGRNTSDYYRFAKGFWVAGAAANVIVSDDFAVSNGATLPPIPFNHSGFHTYASLDPGWSNGGDVNALSLIKCGIGVDGIPQIEFPDSEIRISPMLDRGASKEDYRKLVAREVVMHLEKASVSPDRFCLDINGDGGLMLGAINEVWRRTGVVGISSLEQADDDRYSNLVTQYWFSVRNLISTGRVRGYNVLSGYSSDLKERNFTRERTKLKVEKKDDMRSRIKRSPDAGDSISYCCYLICRRFGAISSYLSDVKRSQMGINTNTAKAVRSELDRRRTPLQDKRGVFSKSHAMTY